MKKMKPILFSTPMVQAIKEDRKTMTRRVVTRKGYDDQINNLENTFARHSHENVWHIGKKLPNRIMPQNAIGVSPRYSVGDILWVREAWRMQNYGYDPATKTYEGQELQFRADFTDVENAVFGRRGGCAPCKWKPSIHMARKNARIFLRVTSVRAERLWDITEEDAVREGCGPRRHSKTSVCARQDFMHLWQRLNDKRDGGKYAYIVNPWVWVYGFEVITKEEAEREAA